VVFALVVVGGVLSAFGVGIEVVVGVVCALAVVGVVVSAFDLNIGVVAVVVYALVVGDVVGSAFAVEVVVVGVVCVYDVVDGVESTLVVDADVDDSKLDPELESKSTFTAVSHLVCFGLALLSLRVRVAKFGEYACASHSEAGAFILALILALTSDQMVILSFLFIIGLVGRLFASVFFP